MWRAVPARSPREAHGPMAKRAVALTGGIVEYLRWANFRRGWVKTNGGRGRGPSHALLQREEGGLLR